MTFEELSVGADVAKLNQEHPFYKYEYVVIDLLRNGRDHPEEHTNMVKHWNLPIKDNNKYGGELTVLNGIKNRVWHILLHYKYWKETNINLNLVKEMLEAHPEIDLELIPLPVISS